MKRTEATRHSKPGDTVAVKHPSTGVQTTGFVSWVSPTRATFQILLADGSKAYQYAEFDGTYPPPTPAVPWKMDKTAETAVGLKPMAKRASIK